LELDHDVTHIRYAAAACQTDLPNAIDREGMKPNTDRMLAMVQCAVDGSAPFLPVRLAKQHFEIAAAPRRTLVVP
jgi:hypothetical protein